MGNKKALLLLFIIMFLVMVGFGIIIPVLPFFAEEIGASPTELGWLMAVYSLMQLLFAPMWGRISDRIGRKPVLLIGIAGLALSFFLFAISTELWMLFAARIIGGILSSANMPTSMAYVADITTPEDRGKGMGIIGAAVGLGFIFGPAIGGLFSKVSLNTPFWIAGIVSLITFVFVLFVLKESLSREERELARRRNAATPWGTVKGTMGILYFLSFFISFSLAGLEATFAYYAAVRAGIDTVNLGYIFMIMGFAGAAVQGGLVGRFIKKFGEGKVIQAGIIVSIIGFGLILLIKDFFTAALFLTIFGLGNGVIRPSVSSLLTKINTSGHGSVTGVLSSFESLGRILGPPLAGLLYETMIDLPYISGALISVVAFVLYRIYDGKVKVRGSL
ncbi:arabinose efflux permease family protein [Schinkia azotoformans MEV2011]|uniref:Arabinose efflux permease family protein n=1 Tax=Schinkia azotoformans MEV2011 TaxID=1348973 RepID=A0A072NQ30_SCHAZ|nr:tetracycline resistance MFS efflux pump [Schinkia azotoformans]KEF39779.1 arabinose efflux permease family protein [Schinkia azotoformans MEV2011]MEC1695001.1 tetracycline resistance MFS efflux pump [Schinkia azotoformans]MEC1716390.1 tetracycline resistance MFS efflux pump [Schinkia azotoformans]MEC1722287.1 tetracycline resistance MFS efflux pump [Schinkia azotoformans]MEC1726807.1 tetracycline resistance MFS efflux pump [Schinkia azotoformans]